MTDYHHTIKDFMPCSPREEADRQQMLLIIGGDGCLPGLKGQALFRDPVGHMTVSALVFNRKRDKMLMVRHDIYGTWTWMGGHADGMMDLEAVAVKEAKEESGIQTLKKIYPGAVALHTLPVSFHVKKGQPVSAHLHLNVSYAFEGDEGEELKACPGENTGAAWIKMDELEYYSNEPDFIQIYRDILERIKKYEKK